jgi:hypothetical protein
MSATDDMNDEELENIPEDVEIHMIGTVEGLQRDGVLFHAKKPSPQQ